MNKRWRNIFFLCGVAAVVIMLLTLDTDWSRIKEVMSQAGIWFPVILVLWGIIYLMNAVSFGLIINDGTGRRVPFGIYAPISVSGCRLWRCMCCCTLLSVAVTDLMSG